MKSLSRLLALLSLFAFSPVAQAQLAASNVRPAQRAGTKLVDIDYDVTGTTSPVDVALQISADGGSTWTVPASTLSGAIGGSVSPASNLRITWNAGADWNQQVSTQTQFRLSVTEAAVVPTGFALIPAGSFTMGDALDGSSGAPTHTVTVSAYCMAKNLVTWAEWQTVKTWAASNGYTDFAAGAGKADNHPVQTVSWWDGIKYCNARSQKEGLTPVYMVNSAVMKTGTTAPTVNWTANGYRLPTEAEWEKAARGGLSGKRFPWGDTISQSQANYGASLIYGYDLSRLVNNLHPTYATGSTPYTSPVGSFAANGYGLNDMAGNVKQWCWDWYGSYDMGSPTDPRGVSSGSFRVFRGGSWGDGAVRCCVAYRVIFHDPSSTNHYFGFRVAHSLASATADSANVTWDTRDAVSIATQPTSATASQGASASFSVTAAGGEPYSYQWKKNGASISGATAATLTLNNVQGADTASYTVVVTGLGSVTSNAATLTVDGPLRITVQPVSQAVVQGGSTSFLAVAASSETIYYQWYKGATPISGATSSTLSLSNVAKADEGSYRCFVSDADELILSSTAALTVNVPATVATQPIGQTAVQGNSVSFSVVAAGTGPFTYQWRLGGVNISGATAATYTIASVLANQAGLYSCVVTNAYGSATSADASLVVNVPPSIGTQPGSQTVLQGANASFSVTATGTTPFTYQWKKDGSAVGGATSATYAISSVQGSQAGSYTCVVTNVAGSATSSAAVLTVNVPPTVVTPPVNASVNAGSGASFSVTAAGSTPATYQWKKNGVAIAGATATTMSLSAVGIVEEGIYSCVITNAYGTVESAGGRLTATVLAGSPDTDGDWVSDSLEKYLASLGLGFDPATDSADALARLKAIVPLLGDFYSSDQMRGLALGQAVLEPQASGKFRLSLGLEESADLSTWTPKAVSAGDVTINSGKLGVDIQPASVKTKFYRLQGKP
jgi:formylglycine-generating enzyme required for sulfatase activity